MALGLAVVVPFVTLGPLSAHMLVHIVTMSIVAPVAAAGWALLGPQRAAGGSELWAATTLQVAVLWAWHVPAAHRIASFSAVGSFAMHATLLAAAFWFWLSLIRLRPADQWQGILALLITGKLACLLAGLLVFAPRPLFAHHHHASDALDDQHLAGLLMIVACPASYVLAGVLMATRLVGLMQIAQRGR